MHDSAIDLINSRTLALAYAVIVYIAMLGLAATLVQRGALPVH